MRSPFKPFVLSFSAFSKCFNVGTVNLAKSSLVTTLCSREPAYRLCRGIIKLGWKAEQELVRSRGKRERDLSRIF
jgi:hypothetical protein